MTKSILTFILVSSIVSLFVSCEGDCKDVQIESVEWVTKYVDRTKIEYRDTTVLADYSVIRSEREPDRRNNAITHFVTIRNESTQYNVRVALRISYEYNYSRYYAPETKYVTFDYVTIEPKKTFTFEKYTQLGNESSSNSCYEILQEPVSFRRRHTSSYKERKDELKTKTITVNSCRENVEALREKYKTIKELYEQKTKNNG